MVTPCQHDEAPSRIPECLGVHVGVAVDEAGTDGVAGGVDLAIAPARRPWADEDDPIAAHRDIGSVRRAARAVDQEPVANHQVISHNGSLSRRHQKTQRSF